MTSHHFLPAFTFQNEEFESKLLPSFDQKCFIVLQPQGLVVKDQLQTAEIKTRLCTSAWSQEFPLLLTDSERTQVCTMNKLLKRYCEWCWNHAFFTHVCNTSKDLSLKWVGQSLWETPKYLFPVRSGTAVDFCSCFFHEVTSLQHLKKISLYLLAMQALKLCYKYWLFLSVCDRFLQLSLTLIDFHSNINRTFLMLMSIS